MVKNRRANAVLFGFDFQRNAAIILMLERIKELRSVRLEGNEEDIELTSGGIDEETLEALTKIILYNVIRRRITIDKIRRGVCL